MAEFQPRACVLTALRTHGAEFKRYVRGRAPPDDVDDILQMAALRAVEGADTLRDPTRVLPWLYRIHRRVLIDAARKRSSERRMMECVAAEASIASDAAPVTREAALGCGCSVAQVRELSPAYAAILNLVDIGGASLGDAAQSLNISVNNAAVRLHRARAALKKRLLEHCGVTSLRTCGDCRCSYEGCCAA